MIKSRSAVHESWGIVCSSIKSESCNLIYPAMRTLCFSVFPTCYQVFLANPGESIDDKADCGYSSSSYLRPRICPLASNSYQID